MPALRMLSMGILSFFLFVARDNLLSGSFILILNIFSNNFNSVLPRSVSRSLQNMEIDSSKAVTSSRKSVSDFFHN